MIDFYKILQPKMNVKNKTHFIYLLF